MTANGSPAGDGHGSAPLAVETPSASDVRRPPHRVIMPRRGWSILRFGELFEYRELVWRFSRRDITLRYRQTALGVIWVLLQPLLAAGIFTFVFGKVAKLPSDGVPYFVFAFSGMLTWNAFSNTLSRASQSVLSNANMVTKVFFPRVLLPLSVATAAVIDAFVGLGMMVVLLVLNHIPFTWQFATFPVWLLIALLMAEGFGMIASALMVRFRDVQYVLPVLIQFLLYVTPIAYSVQAVPKSLRVVVYVNPLTGLMEGTRWCLLGRGVLNPGLLTYTLVATVASVLVGALVFERFERSFSDVI